MQDDGKVRNSICRIAKLIYDKDLSDASGGNVSVRDKDKIYITPRRAGENSQFEIEPNSIIVTDLCAVPVSGNIKEISREALIHYYIYQNFPDINAVFHAHPFFIMVFGSAHKDIPTVSEATRNYLGEEPISCIEEVVPGSTEMADCPVAEGISLGNRASFWACSGSIRLPHLEQRRTFPFSSFSCMREPQSGQKSLSICRPSGLIWLRFLEKQKAQEMQSRLSGSVQEKILFSKARMNFL